VHLRSSQPVKVGENVPPRASIAVRVADLIHVVRELGLAFAGVKLYLVGPTPSVDLFIAYYGDVDALKLCAEIYESDTWWVGWTPITPEVELFIPNASGKGIDYATASLEGDLVKLVAGSDQKVVYLTVTPKSFSETYVAFVVLLTYPMPTEADIDVRYSFGAPAVAGIPWYLVLGVAAAAVVGGAYYVGARRKR